MNQDSNVTPSYILGLDLGIASVGWAVVNKGSQEVMDCGVRCFKEPIKDESKESLASVRRKLRSQRRTIFRKSNRMKQIKNLLLDQKLIQSEEDYKKIFVFEVGYKPDKNDPWALRTLALERVLSNEELTRVLIHLAKHRGYKSNRKIKDQEAESQTSESVEEKKKVLKACKENQGLLEENKSEYQTIGQMFYQEGRQKRNKKDNYEASVSRELIEQEIDAIFEKQQELGQQYCQDDTLKNAYKKISLYQMPIKSMKDMVGNCTFYPDEKRAPRDSYSYALFSLNQEINNLKLKSKINKQDEIELKCIDSDIRQKIIEKAKNTKELNYTDIREFLLGTDANSYEYKFNKPLYKKYDEECRTKLIKSLENKKNSKLKQQTIEECNLGDINEIKENYKLYKNVLNKIEELDLNVYQELVKETYEKLEKDKFFDGFKGYQEIKKAFDKDKDKDLISNIDLMDLIAETLIYEKEDESIKKYLKNQSAQLNEELSGILTEDVLEKICTIPNFRGVGSISIKAAKKINDYLKQGDHYDKACGKAGFDFKNSIDAGTENRVPAIMEVMSTTNPVVIRALSQMRKTVNAIIRKHGTPDQIIVETAREIAKTKKEKTLIEDTQKSYEKRNKLAKKFFNDNNASPTKKNILRHNLWESQGGICIYSGEQISPDMLLEENGVEIDHIIPLSLSFDDSFYNKVLCTSQSNQEKGQQTPYQAWGHDHEKWNKVKVSTYNIAKYNGKVKKILSEEPPEIKDFLSRNLNDTRYISKEAVKVLQQLKLNSDPQSAVQSVKGKITSLLRRKWIDQIWRNSPDFKSDVQLEQLFKAIANNEDKRAIDDRHHALDAIIIACTNPSLIQKNTKAHKHKDDIEIELPYDKWGEAVIENMNKITVSRMPNRKTTGELHKQTIISEYDPKIEKRSKYNRDMGFIKVHNGYASKKDHYRLDVFKEVTLKGGKSKFQLVPVRKIDLKNDHAPTAIIPYTKEKHVIDNDKYKYEFLFSLFPNDFVVLEDEKGEITEGYYRIVDINTAQIKLKDCNGRKIYKYGKEDVDYTRKGVATLKNFKKYHIDILGNKVEVKKEKRIWMENRKKTNQKTKN